MALRFRAGYVRLIDLDDDLQVRCLKRPAQRGDAEQKDGERKDGEKKAERQGSKPRESKNAKGQTVLTCIGGALARGSHFQLSGFSMRFVILAPEGTTGSITGNVVTREPGEKKKKKGDAPAADDDSESGDADADESDAVAEIQSALAAQGK